MLLATEEAIAVAHAFALGDVDAAMIAADHALGHALALAGLLACRRVSAARPVQGATHPPDADEDEDEEEQVSHDADLPRRLADTTVRPELVEGHRQGFDRLSPNGSGCRTSYGNTKRESLARTPHHTFCRRSHAAASVASFFAKQKRITCSSRPSAKKADTGIAATPVTRVSRCAKAVSGSSEIAP